MNNCESLLSHENTCGAHSKGSAHLKLLAVEIISLM